MVPMFPALSSEREGLLSIPVSICFNLKKIFGGGARLSHLGHVLTPDGDVVGGGCVVISNFPWDLLLRAGLSSLIFTSVSFLKQNFEVCSFPTLLV